MPTIYQGKTVTDPNQAVVLDCLRQLRSLRLEPPTNRVAGVTDIKMFRVPIDVGKGRKGIVMSAAATK